MQFDAQAREFIDSLMRARVDMMNVANEATRLETDLLSRHAVTTAKLASLFSIGADPKRALSEPLITLDMLEWANDFNLQGHQKVLNWIATGETGPTSGTNAQFSRQINVVRNFILKFLMMDFDEVRLIAHESDHERLAVTHHRNWISRRNIFSEMIKHRMFKRCGYPPKSVIENILSSLCETGELDKATQDRLRGVFKEHGVSRQGRWGVYYKADLERIRKNTEMEET